MFSIRSRIIGRIVLPAMFVLFAGLGLWLGGRALAAPNATIAAPNATGVVPDSTMAVPDAITATTCTVDDDGPADYGSIGAAVAAPGCDIIDVAAGHYTENITVTRSVSIVGINRTYTTVEGDGGRVFSIAVPTVTVLIANMNVVNGNGGSEHGDCGGGISNEGKLVVYNTAVMNNYAYYGGGICNTGVLTLTQSIVDFNQAVFGGGLYNDEFATATIKNSQISGHIVDHSGGGIISLGALVIVDSEINNNTTVDDTSHNGTGGGLNVNGPTTIENSIIRENYADFGGGITIGVDGRVTISNSQILTNTASGINAPPYTRNQTGGGIRVGGVLTLTHSTVRGNSASGYYNNQYGTGGGIYISNQTPTRLLIINSVISDNTASGGAGIAESTLSVYTETVTIDIYASVISNNHGDGILGSKSQGVLFIRNSQISDNDGTGIDHAGALTLKYCVVSNNTHGGVESSVATIRYSTIRDNTRASGIPVYDKGGGIRSGYSLLLEDSTVSGNSSSDDGGGIYSAGGTITVNNSTISGNTTGTDGGGIALFFSDLTLTNSTVSGNSADGNGGGIFLEETGATVQLDSATVVLNTADADAAGGGGGGGIYRNADAGDFNLSESIIAQNVDGSQFAVEKDPDCYGDFIGGWNLIGAYDNFDCTGLTGAGNYSGTVNDPLDPQIDPLADNGGPTLTHALDPASPAVDGTPTTCPDEDQRGVDRPQDGDDNGTVHCDLGAYELGDCANPVAPELSIDQEGSKVLVSWAKDPANREYVLFRTTDYVQQTDLISMTRHGRNHTDYEAIGDLQTNYVYLIRGENACGERSNRSNKVGEYDYGVQPGGNGRFLKFSMITLPLEGDNLPTSASEVIDAIDPSGSVRGVARWVNLTQSWIMYRANAWFGTPDFAVFPGDVLFIGVDSSGPDTFAWVGDVPGEGSIQNVLLANAVNTIMVPLDQSGGFTMTADGLAAEIVGVTRVAVWERTGQQWYGGDGPNFSIRLGRPYLILTDGTAPVVWP